MTFIFGFSYHNPPQPPVNPAQVPQIIPAQENRFGNEDPDRFIFDVFDQNPIRGIPVTPSTVKRPLPSLIHNSVQERPNCKFLLFFFNFLNLLIFCYFSGFTQHKTSTSINFT